MQSLTQDSGSCTLPVISTFCIQTAVGFLPNYYTDSRNIRAITNKYHYESCDSTDLPPWLVASGKKLIFEQDIKLVRPFSLRLTTLNK
jgi:hypothetical protein